MLLRKTALLIFKFSFVVTFAFAQTPISENLEIENSAKDSLQYTRLKKSLYKTRFGKQIYNLFFVDIHNRQSSQEKEIETNPFENYEGLIIRNITVKQLDVLGQNINDTTKTGNNLQKFVSNNLHSNTRESLIRNTMIVIKEGDLVESSRIFDNERILRNSNIIHDVRFLPVPIENNTEEIDILVLIQDVWPIAPVASFSSFKKFSVGLNNSNLFGSSHTFDFRYGLDKNDSLQKNSFTALYSIPYYKKTFISREMGLAWEARHKQLYLKASKPFLTINTKHAGSLEIGFNENIRDRRHIENIDSVFLFKNSKIYGDAWFGKAFSLGNSKLNQSRKIVLASIFSFDNYIKRPSVNADSNMTYWNSNQLLISLGYSNRKYQKDILIYGFGRTEDVPTGQLFNFTAGKSFTEFGWTTYAGARFSAGQYLNRKSGYIHGTVDLGTYFKNKKTHLGVLDISTSYFTQLIPIGLARLRQFINLNYTLGFNRDELEYIKLTEESRIRGLNSTYLIGKKRLNLNLETVLFSSNSFLGFRIAYFTYADLGTISEKKSLFKATLYQGYGIGVRLRNENLTFSTLEFRIAYYPNIPYISNSYRVNLSSSRVLRLKDFDITAPQIVPFH